jgi:hypothetical protein
MSDKTIVEINRILAQIKKNFVQEVNIRNSIAKRIDENLSMRKYYISALCSEILSLMAEKRIAKITTTVLCNEEDDSEFYLTLGEFAKYRAKIEYFYAKTDPYTLHGELWYKDTDGTHDLVQNLPYRIIEAFTMTLIKLI